MKTNWYLGETKDYSKFNFIDSNRDINDSNLKKIERSILEIGLQVPIVVNENYEIIEGQHRFVALRKNNLVIPYIVSARASESDIDGLQESRKWTAMDFCKSRATKGDVSCKIALDLAEEWYQDSDKKMHPQRTIELVMDGRTSSGIRTKLRNGSYIANTDCAKNVYDAIQVMSEMDMGTTPFGQKIVRTLKALYYDFLGIDLDIIQKMTRDNYIKAYSNENDQYEYMRDMYLKAKKQLKK